MSTPKPADYAEAVTLYRALIATNPAVLCKGATVPNTSVNGHMFSYLSKSGVLALRLPADTRTAFLKKYKTVLCQQYGRIQEEYVEVPTELLRKTSTLKTYFAESFAYANALKPKANKPRQK